MKPVAPLFAALAAVSMLAAAGLARAQTVTVIDRERSVVLGPADLAALPSRTVTLEDHGRRRTFTGPTVFDVLRRAEAVGQPPLHGQALAASVTVTASDGYAVTFGVGELDASINARGVILATRGDTGPLGAEEGPVRLVAEGDLRPARSVRSVTRLTMQAPAVAPPRP